MAIQTECQPKSVVLVDDHPVVALGLRLAFQDQETFALIGTAVEPQGAPELIEKLAPDVVIVDLVFAGTVRLSLVSACREALPDSAIVVFSSLPARLYEEETLRAGADAYVSKDHDLSNLVDVLTEVAVKPRGVERDRVGASPERSAGASDRGPLIGDVHLTPREVEIGRLLSRGFSVARIAEEIGVSANTVAAHRDNIRRKLGCRDTTELVARLARIQQSSGGHE